MADLGSISYTDVNSGTTSVDRSQEIAGLQNLLSSGKQLVDESIKAKVTGDMMEAVNPMDQGATPGADADVHTVPIERAGSGRTEYPEGSPEAALSIEMDRLTAVIEQGQVSQAKMAERRIKEVLADAQNKYPWLYDELRSRAGSVMAGSVKLDQLAMADAAASEAADFASKQRQEVLDEAYGLIENGGLGMPRWITPDDPQFVAEYVDRRRKRQVMQDAALEEGLFLGNQSLAARDKAGKIGEDMQGKNSYVRASMENIFDTYQIGDLLDELGKGDDADFTRIANIRSSTLPEGIAALKKEKVNLTTHFNQNVNPQFRDSPYFAEIKGQQDDVLAEIDLYINAFEGVMNDTPGATDMIKEVLLIRGADFGRRLPTPLQDLTAFAQTPGGEFVLSMVGSDKTAKGLVLMNDYATAYTSAMSQMYPRYFGPTPDPANVNTLLYRTSGGINVTPNMPAADINKEIRAHQRESNEPFLVRTYGIDDEIDVSTKTAAMWLENWEQNLDRIPANAAPEAAGHYLTGLNYSLTHQVDLGESREEPVEIIMKGLASDGMTNAIEATQQRGANQRIAFARTAKSWYEEVAKPTDRRNEVAFRYANQRVDGTNLSELVSVNLDATNGADGSFQYRIDTVKVEELAKARREQDAVLSLDVKGRAAKPLAVYYNEIEGEIMDFMEPIAKEVTTQIHIARNLRRASTAADAQDPAINNFQAYYSGLLEPGMQTPWIDVFNHFEE